MKTVVRLLLILGGIAYGLFSLFCVLVGYAFAFNIFATDIGHTEEDYAFLIPVGFAMLFVYLLVSVFILKKISPMSSKIVFLLSALITCVIYIVTHR